jgi:hypothetical protein
VPEARLEALRLVKFTPEIAGSVAGKRASGTVPEAKLEALRLVNPEPAPVTVVNVPVLAAKLPLASRDTIVFAPLDVVAVVRALSIVPVVIAEAFKLVKFAPDPDTAPLKVVAVMVAAVKLPEASRATIVLAPLDELAVVRALATVPVDIAVPFKAVIKDPSPVNVVAVILAAAKLPEASRATIVEAPFVAAAVVLALANVPDVIFDALVVSVVADGAKPVMSEAAGCSQTGA